MGDYEQILLNPKCLHGRSGSVFADVFSFVEMSSLSNDDKCHHLALPLGKIVGDDNSAKIIKTIIISGPFPFDKAYYRRFITATHQLQTSKSKHSS